MAFDSVFHGAPVDVAAPGTKQSPSLGVDVTNKELYISSGNGWEELSSGGSGTISGSGTTGFIPEFTDTTELGDSVIDNGVTTADVLTVSKNTVIAGRTSVGGTNAVLDYDGKTGLAVIPDTYTALDTGDNFSLSSDVESNIAVTADFGGGTFPANSTNFLMSWNGVNLADGAGTQHGSLGAQYNFVINNNTRATKTVEALVAQWNEVDQYGTCPITHMVATFNEFSPNGNTGVVTNVYGVWNSYKNDGTVSPTNMFGFYNSDLGVSGSANRYYEWHDSRGVRRTKEDSTFNSVGQAIEALYNPQFTKYTPGATNFERVVLGQWNSNVAEIGAEAGGTGTLRDVRVIGNALRVPVLKPNTVYSAAGTALPSAVTVGAGARAFVSDANASTFNTAYTGGGSNNVPVFSDGTVWRIG